MRELRGLMAHFHSSTESSSNTGTNNSGEAETASPELFILAVDCAIYE